MLELGGGGGGWDPTVCVQKIGPEQVFILFGFSWGTFERNPRGLGCGDGEGDPARDALEGKGPRRRPQKRVQAVGGGCRSGWGRLLLVTNAIETGTGRQGDSGWALFGRPGGGVWHKALVVGSVSLWRRLLASRL